MVLPRINLFDILFPSWNIFTLIGILFIAGAILMLGVLFILFWINPMIATTMAKTFNPNLIILTLFVVGIVFIWGFSFLENFFASTRGIVLGLGTATTLIVVYLLYVRDLFKK